MERAIPTYRVYVVSTDDHIKEPAHLLECADDQEAIGQAVQYTNDHTVELWGDAPDFVEVGEAGIAVADAMRHECRVQLVG
jgi:hypothetical protein